MSYFTMEECTRSEKARQRGIPNIPTPEQARQIVQTVEELLDPLREAWARKLEEERLKQAVSGCAAKDGTAKDGTAKGCAAKGCAAENPGIRITSGYRSEALNDVVGGSKTSAHNIGCGFDLVPINGKMREFKDFCREFFAGRAFDQLISEAEDAEGTPRWLHIGRMDRQGRQRRQLLSMRGGMYTPMTR